MMLSSCLIKECLMLSKVNFSLVSTVSSLVTVHNQERERMISSFITTCN
jgi:hypothetical protein